MWSITYCLKYSSFSLWEIFQLVSVSLWIPPFLVLSVLFFSLHMFMKFLLIDSLILSSFVFCLQDICVCAQSLSCVWLFVTPWTVAHHTPLSMVFSRQEYWHGLPCFPSWDLPNPGIKPMSLVSLVLIGEFLTTEVYSSCSVFGF